MLTKVKSYGKYENFKTKNVVLCNLTFQPTVPPAVPLLPFQASQNATSWNIFQHAVNGHPFVWSLANLFLGYYGVFDWEFIFINFSSRPILLSLVALQSFCTTRHITTIERDLMQKNKNTFIYHGRTLIDIEQILNVVNEFHFKQHFHWIEHFENSN